MNTKQLMTEMVSEATKNAKTGQSGYGSFQHRSIKVCVSPAQSRTSSKKDWYTTSWYIGCKKISRAQAENELKTLYGYN